MKPKKYLINWRQTMKTYQIATKQENHPAHKGVFYSATKYHIDVGTDDNFIISGERGGTGTTAVDDVIKIVITDQNDSTNSASYEYDYSNGCSGTITPIRPVNLNSKNSTFNNLRGKTVKVFVQFSDKCGGVEWGTAIWLTLEKKSS